MSKQIYARVAMKIVHLENVIFHQTKIIVIYVIHKKILLSLKIKNRVMVLVYKKDISLKN